MKSKFIENVYEVSYLLSPLDKYSPTTGYYISTSEGKLIRQNILFEAELDAPLLNKSEYIHNVELNEKYHIKDSFRGSDNSFYYVIKKTVEETENSLKRKIDLEDKVANIKCKNEENLSLKLEKDEIEKRYLDLKEKINKSWICKKILKIQQKENIKYE